MCEEWTQTDGGIKPQFYDDRTNEVTFSHRRAHSRKIRETLDSSKKYGIKTALGGNEDDTLQ